MKMLDTNRSKQSLRRSEGSAGPSPSSSSPPNQRRRTKVPSESIAHDLLQRTVAGPGYAEKKASTPMEDASPDEYYDSFQLTAYPVLAHKDRFKSASLEWTNGSNGSVTPRLTHYNTHPPLDFKGLKEKLKKLIGSPHEAHRKASANFPSSAHEDRKGALNALSEVPYVTSPSADMMSSEMPEGNRSVSEILLQNVAKQKGMGLKRTTRVVDVTEDSDSVPWKDLADRVAESDTKLQRILNRHRKEREDLKKKHERQWAQFRSQISISEESQDQELDSNSLNRSNQAFNHQTEPQMATLEPATSNTTQCYSTKSQTDRINNGLSVNDYRTDAEGEKTTTGGLITASLTGTGVNTYAGHESTRAVPDVNYVNAMQDTTDGLPIINRHLTGSQFQAVSAAPQSTRSIDVRCLSPQTQHQNEAELAKLLENQMTSLMRQHQLTELDLAAAAASKTQKLPIGAGVYPNPYFCYQYPCVPPFEQLQSPTASSPIYQENTCFPVAFPGNRTDFPQRPFSSTSYAELLRHQLAGKRSNTSAKQSLCNGVGHQVFPFQIAPSNLVAPLPSAVKMQPVAAHMPFCDNANNVYTLPCFNSFQLVPLSFLCPPSMQQHSMSGFGDVHQPFLSQTPGYQPYLTWS